MKCATPARIERGFFRSSKFYSIVKLSVGQRKPSCGQKIFTSWANGAFFI
ncbi:MAG: hypothetical protein JWR54_381 [Mucilaginibacter sp.]|nr:hypothetical protein [Mucilaginibacter sp.]